tara:strand:- start:109 stop:312 length:204 start_codon:yes stop_codon:yes gene_type:complete
VARNDRMLFELNLTSFIMGRRALIANSLLIKETIKGEGMAENKEIGGSCWVRTSDQLIKSQLLYQLS